MNHVQIEVDKPAPKSVGWPEIFVWRPTDEQETALRERSSKRIRKGTTHWGDPAHLEFVGMGGEKAVEVCLKALGVAGAHAPLYIDLRRWAEPDVTATLDLAVPPGNVQINIEVKCATARYPSLKAKLDNADLKDNHFLAGVHWGGGDFQIFGWAYTGLAKDGDHGWKAERSRGNDPQIAKPMADLYNMRVLAQFLR